MKKFSVIMLLLTVMFITVSAGAGEVEGVQTGGWNATLGLIVGLIIGLGVMFLFMRRNPHIVDNIKKQLKEVKRDRSKAIMNFIDFRAHLKKEIADFPSDLKERIERLISKE